MGKRAKKALCKSAWMDLPVCIKIKEELSEDLTMLLPLCLDQSIADLLQDLRLFGCTAEPLSGLKILISCLGNGKFERTEIVVKIVMKYFIISNSKRVLASILEGIKDKELRTQVVATFSELLKELLASIFQNSSIEEGRYMIELLSICLCHGFEMAQSVVQVHLAQILHFLQWFLENLLSNPENHQVQNLEQDVAAALKCVTQLVRRCFHCKIAERALIVENSVILDKALLLCMDVLAKENFGWDCYNVAAMTWMVLWKIMLNDDSLLQKVKEILSNSSINKDCGTFGYDSSLACNEDDNKNLKLIAGLSFCNGTLLSIGVKLLVCSFQAENETKQCCLLECILHYLRVADKRCITLSDQVNLSKCFVQCVTTMLEASALYPRELKKMLLLKTSMHKTNIITDLLYYAVEKLEHPTDAVRHQANEMLSNVLALGASIGAPDFSSGLVENVMLQSWQKRSTFTALSCALQHVDSQSVLDQKPDILERLLDAMQHQTLAPYSSETYKILASQCWKSSEKGSEEQFKAFIGPTLTAMCKSSAHSLRLLVDYCFVKLLRVYGEGCVEYVLGDFKGTKFHTNYDYTFNVPSLSAFLSCLRAAEVNGYLKDPEATLHGTAHNVLIRSSLVHEDDEIRHLGFALLCESVKPSKLISGKTLGCLKYAIPFNVVCQDPAFRQRFLNSLKKLFLRLNGSVLHLVKVREWHEHSVIGDEDHEKDLLSCYQKFISWIFEFTISKLHPSAPYSKRFTCFSILHLAVDIFFDLDGKKILNIVETFSPGAIGIFFDMLSDPYDDIKQQSFSLLCNSDVRNAVKSVLHQERLENIYANALQQAYECAKPEQCDDAAYHLKLFSKLRGSQSDSCQKVLLGVCSKLLNLLNKSVSAAEKSLYLAATTSPMYGLLHCLKIIFQSVDFRSMAAEDTRQWHNTVSDVITTSVAASKVVLPVVGSVSPEGYLPDICPSPTNVVNSAEPDDAWNELPDVIKPLAVWDDSDERETRALAQQVLICCWRSVKESSLLLQEISSCRFPLDSSETEHDGVLAWNQLLQIGEHLRKQLMEARHRGAFEITYSSFSTCCHRLWKTEHQALCRVPEKWLHSILSSIQDPVLSSGLCATRRSAGLPFFVQALLSGNKTAQNKRHLYRVMSVLLSLCGVSDSDNAGLIPKIHSLNVLRGLVKDASLGEEIVPYVSQSLQVSLAGFNSSVWAVRNSSTLLFSVLFNRIFGVKRDKNDYLFLKNRLSGNDFFSRLPGLYPFLITQLEKSSENLNKRDLRFLSPTLYPILLLLSRIYPSTIQPTCGINLDTFAPLLINCRACPVYKTRVAAARALASILHYERRLLTLKKCCENLLEDVEERNADVGTESSPTNSIHGGLLQIKEILLRHTTKNENYTIEGVWMAVSCVSHAFHRMMPYLATRQNNCPLTRSSSMEIFFLIHEMRENLFKEEADAEWDKLSKDIRLASVEELTRSCATSYQMPGYSILREVAVKISLCFSDKPTDILSLLEGLLLCSNTDALYSLLNALTSKWKNIRKTWTSTDFALQLEKMIVRALLQDTYHTRIRILMYRTLFEVGGSAGVQCLLENSMKESETCNSSQSTLLEALINFQSECIGLLFKNSCPEICNVVDRWICILCSSSRCYENSEDVRLAVANSLLDNVSMLHDPENILGDKVVRLWMVVVHLLCDEESDIRKVASYIVHKAVSMSSNKVYHFDHPCVDSLALRYALVTLILTHGQHYSEECKRALLALAENEPQTVPICSEVSSSEAGSSPCGSDFLPGFFQRSAVNIYIDTAEVTQLSKVGIDSLDSAATETVQDVLRKFDCIY